MEASFNPKEYHARQDSDVAAFQQKRCFSAGKDTIGGSPVAGSQIESHDHSDSLFEDNQRVQAVVMPFTGMVPMLG
jgi:hypothetical protein